MKICDSWLQEHVAHGLDAPALAQRLTMLGLEVDTMTTEGTPLQGVVVGKVVALRRHPNADKLSLCQVDVGTGEPLGIVCGAPNVREGGLYPTALEGARLPGGLVIKPTRLRGEPSAGMLCAARELGLEGGPDGLLELDPGAVPGTDVSALLKLGDPVLDLNVTPNRADCFSILGIAREVAAQGSSPVVEPDATPVPAMIPDVLPVVLPDADACPRFAGRIIRGLRADAVTPLWMRERLRRCGIRPLNPVVDVTNYVMLESGQPMHAYDLAHLTGGVAARRARPGESLRLLDGQEVQAGADVLVIADADGPVSLAGIMGGARTAVSASTRDIFLEAAFFAPTAMAGRARRFGLHTEASLRFERGVDPTLPARAMERATRLLLAIAGGQPGPVADHCEASSLPVRQAVCLRQKRLAAVLGADVPAAAVGDILARLRMRVESAADGWLVTPPAARFDIEREEDLVEEVARVHGYERIPAVPGAAAIHLAAAGEDPDPLRGMAASLAARGYQEAITYSFIEPGLARRFGADAAAELALANPISAELAVMRQSLWPGLALAARENLRRQQPRVRLFEMGSRYLARGTQQPGEDRCIAGIATGTRWPEQWGARSQPVDVFDVKGDIEALLARAGWRDAVAYDAAAPHPALHPGRSARVSVSGHDAGWIGELHPSLAAELELPGAVVFELRVDGLRRVRAVHAGVSMFPAIRRDVAVVVSRDVPVSKLLAAARAAVGAAVLREVFVFDIYTGSQVGAAEKSVAIGLILQDTSRTLTDEDAQGVLRDVRAALGREFQARIRE